MHFLQCVFQMTAKSLMTLLNSSSEVVNNPDALFFRYGTNLLIDGPLSSEIFVLNDKFGFSWDNC